ncbi:MAG: SynChlorMet cassette radical SAM/SPASM protein ScmE [Armatimonadetes bacterium]|nr:SynChlorMet cassette radical SAM/SPASM protein ScmE [Armatimonadota bacterium]
MADSPVAVMRSPRKVHLEITAKCNLRCRYCYFFAGDSDKYHDLPTEAWLRFFAECGQAGVMHAVIAGGEPFARDDLRELLEGLMANRMRFSLISNGGLLTAEMARFLRDCGRCDSVQISLDGSCPETHDAGRGAGSWDGAVRGLRLLLEHGPAATVRVTIHRHNVDDLAATAKMLLEDFGLPAFSTNAAGYLGACRQHSDSLLLSLAERERAMSTLAMLAERYPGRIGAAAGPLADVRLWRHMDEARRSGAAPSARGGHLTACGCVRAELSVSCDGHYIACSMLPHLRLGRINQDRLTDIWRDAPALVAMRARAAIPLSDFAFCDGCEWRDHCTGNCPGLAYSLTGQVDHPSPDACLRRYVEAGGRIV